MTKICQSKIGHYVKTCWTTNVHFIKWIFSLLEVIFPLGQHYIMYTYSLLSHLGQSTFIAIYKQQKNFYLYSNSYCAFFFSLPTAKFYSSKWTFCYKAIRVELHVYIIMIIVRILITIEHVQWWKNMHAIYFLFLYNICM